MSRFSRLLLGDVDTEATEDNAREQAWHWVQPNDAEVVAVLFDLQLKAHNEALEGYRAGLRSFDGLLIFAGALVAWMAKFVADLPEGWPASRWFATVAVVAAVLSLMASLLGRRGINRPAHISLTEAHQALENVNVSGAQDWLSRVMHINRRMYAQVNNAIALWLAAATWLLCLAVVMTAFAICCHP